MNENRVVCLRQKDEIDDPLTEILRTGARRLITRAVEVEFDTEHGDVSDCLAQGHTKDELLERAKVGRLPGKGYTLIRPSAVLPRNVDWLWDGYLPRNA